MNRGRRSFIIAAGALISPCVARAQFAAKPLIAYLSGSTAATGTRYLNLFRDGLKELGYVEGRNIEIVARFAEAQIDRIPALIAGLVRLKPALIVTTSIDSAVEAKRLTSTIPIVTPVLADPIHLGLIASYARPGGNVTGIMPYVDGLPSKQLDFARAIVPSAQKVGLLGNMSDPKTPPQRQELEDGARRLGMRTTMPPVASGDDLAAAVRALAADKVDVVIVLQTTLMLSERKQIATLMAAHRLPAIYGYREHADAGGLVSYGVDLPWCFRHAATLVDKILKGTPVAEVSVEFPTRLVMVINLGAARAMGLSLPSTLLMQADHVID
jgi:putative ABC transport system substrate-binding protein